MSDFNHCGKGGWLCILHLSCLSCQQGSSDDFLEKDLTPDRLVAAAKSSGKLKVNLRMQQVRALIVR
jgi:hypothetical protein